MIWIQAIPKNRNQPSILKAHLKAVVIADTHPTAFFVMEARAIA
jgi:hypothetical protein